MLDIDPVLGRAQLSGLHCVAGSDAAAHRAALPQATTLSAHERTLLGEWLDRKTHASA